MMDDMSAVITAISGAGGVMGGSGIAYFMLKTWITKIIQDNSELAREVRDLREKDFAHLERRVAAVEKATDECPITEVERDLKNLLGWHKNTSLVLQAVQQTVNKLEAHRQDDREWMTNMSNTIRELMKNG